LYGTTEPTVIGLNRKGNGPLFRGLLKEAVCNLKSSCLPAHVYIKVS